MIKDNQLMRNLGIVLLKNPSNTFLDEVFEYTKYEDTETRVAKAMEDAYMLHYLITYVGVPETLQTTMNKIKTVLGYEPTVDNLNKNNGIHIFAKNRISKENMVKSLFDGDENGPDSDDIVTDEDLDMVKRNYFLIGVHHFAKIFDGISNVEELVKDINEELSGGHKTGLIFEEKRKIDLDEFTTFYMGEQMIDHEETYSAEDLKDAIRSGFVDGMDRLSYALIMNKVDLSKLILEIKDT